MVPVLTERIRASEEKQVSLPAEAGHFNRLAAIGRSAAGVADEISNPLAIIWQKSGLTDDLLRVSQPFKSGPSWRIACPLSGATRAYTADFTVGEGTIFTINLPIPHPILRKTTMNTMQILIVDDEVEFASTLVERLALRGIAARSVNRGLDALTLVRARIPDVVILDLKMPDLSGLEVLSSIKAIDPAIEAIILTGHGSAAAGIECMEQGAFDYMVKPVDLTALLGKIEQAYRKRKAGNGQKIIGYPGA